MITTTTETIARKEITETLGVVYGSSVRARAVGRDIVGFFRSLFGGEIREYSDLQALTRSQATDRLVEEAQKLGADAVVGVRYTTSDITSTVSEILAYGTAVKIK